MCKWMLWIYIFNLLAFGSRVFVDLLSCIFSSIENPTKEETAKFPCRFFDKVLKICRIQNLKSLFLRLSFCVEIILVSGFFVAQADSIYHCFGSGIWARHEPEAKRSGQRLIPKPRVFFISCESKIYSCCNSNNTTEDNNTTEKNMCKFLYSTEEFALLQVIAAL